MNEPGATRDEAAAAAAAAEAVARSSYGRLVAYLASITGDVAGAEDALGDALVAALRSWPESGVPARPDAWLLTVARRSAIDGWRRRRTADEATAGMARLLDAERLDPESVAFEIPDRRLELMLACAHPAVDPAMRSALMLQAVLGVNAARIASAFLVAPSTMSQRLVRTKAKIKAAGVPFAIPDSTELTGRMGSVLDAIYAAYTVGWDDGAVADGDAVPMPGAFTSEALRLARVVVDLRPTDAEAQGLLAMLLHIEARSPARRVRDGEFVPLDEQDSALWRRDDVQEAEAHLSVALGLGRPGPYQLQAAIQSVHNRRALTGATDWAAIARLYDGIVALAPSIGSAVAQAAAVSYAEGGAAALRLLDRVPRDRVAAYQPYWVVRAHALRLDDDPAGSHEAAAVAIRLTPEGPVKRHLARRFLDRPTAGGSDR